MVSVAPPPASFDIETDVVVVGAGACGLIAGLRALEGGAEVVVLERDARPAGSTSMSSGFIPAAGTRFQRAIGVLEAPEEFAADIHNKAAGGADPAIVKTVRKTEPRRNDRTPSGASRNSFRCSGPTRVAAAFILIRSVRST